MRILTPSPTFVLVSVLAGAFIIPASQAQTPRGAAVPFTTHEAEDSTNRSQGRTVRMTGIPKREDASPEMEASGRAYVQLTAPGDFLDIPTTRAVNALVIRHCIPDAPTGGGITATLSLYVNNKFRQKLTLSSKYNWVYGKPGENGQDNDPAAGQPHVFWDETRAFIQGGLKAGDTLRLQKDAGDTADFYRVDLVDLEMVPGPLAPPADGTYLSAADFGANGTDTADDSEAIQKCIDAAKAAGKIAWIPAGTYYQSEKFNLDGVKLRGAGMWHTEIIGTKEGTAWTGNMGFSLAGDGAEVSNLYINSDMGLVATKRFRFGGKPFTGNPTNWRVENVWVTHTNTGMWLRGHKGVVRGNRIRFTYADAINLNNGASDNLVEHNHVRGNGDDGIALLSELEFKHPASQNNIVRFNTVSAIWWGHNFDLAGGSGHIIEDNVFADNSNKGCFTINLPSAFPMHPVTGAIIRRNSIVRGGGDYAGQKRGAVWILPGSTTISGVVFEDNEIVDPVIRAIQFAGNQNQNIVFQRNVIHSPGADAIAVNSEAKGTIILNETKLTALPAGAKPIVDNAKGNLVIQQSGNSWQ